MPEEPTGKIITRAAGAVQVRATLHWQPGRIWRGPIVPVFSDAGRVRCSMFDEIEESTESRTIAGEIAAFTELELSRTVEAVLRAISAAAGVSEAVLEAGAFRVCSPMLTWVSVVEALARDLRGAGFPVTFGRTWSTMLDADAAIGTGGAGEDLLDFLERHPVWVTNA